MKSRSLIYIYFNNAHYQCSCPVYFPLKPPLQLSLAHNQTNINVSPFSSTFDHRQSVYLSSFQYLTSPFFSFSFNKYLYKSLVLIQPSCLLFYLFRPQQHNTNFLLTSKDELKHPGVSFPNNPKLLLSFIIVNGVLYLFIYLVNYISPSRTIQNRVHKFFGTYNEILRILHIYSLISYPVSNISFNNISNPIPGRPSQLSLATNLQYSNKISNPILRGIHKKAGLDTPRATRFSNPSLGGDLHKTWYSSTST